MRAHPGDLARGAGGRAGRPRGAPGVAHARAPHPQGLDGPRHGGRPARGGHLPLAPGAGRQLQEGGRTPRGAQGVAPQLPAPGALRRGGPAAPGDRRARPHGGPPHERQPAHQPGRARAARGARLAFARRRGALARRGGRRVHARARQPPPGRLRRQRGPGQLPRLLPRRDHLQPPLRGLRGDLARCHVALTPGRRAHDDGRPRDGDPLGALVRGVARGLRADGAPRHVRLLRGLCPARGLDDQPARQVAQGDPRDRLAQARAEPQRAPHLPHLAPGPQRLLPPGPRLPGQPVHQEGLRGACLPPAGRKHAPRRGGGVPHERAPDQRHRGGQAPHAPVARRRGGRSRRGGGPLRVALRLDGARGLCARRRPRVLRRRAHPRGRRRRGLPQGARPARGPALRQHHRALPPRPRRPPPAGPRPGRLRGHFPAKNARGDGLPWLPAGRGRPPPRPRGLRGLEGARLHRGGLHHHALRHDRGQRDVPLAPRHRGARAHCRLRAVRGRAR
mmetsp:Transcript_5277/g.17822  ORF Transcript_5277/g.17822 Transcript_5277/m.17822 type:complete len:505 (-) Transcript_5277:1622-3136(-)